MRFTVYYCLLVADLSSDLLFPMQCSVTCGEGIEVRQVLCRSGDQCDGEKPESIRECKLAPCNGMYCSSQFNTLFSRTKLIKLASRITKLVKPRAHGTFFFQF